MVKYSSDEISRAVAVDMVLVFELNTADGDHYGTIIVEQGVMQYYDIQRADLHPHFQLMQDQVGGYVADLERRSFVQMNYESSCHLDIGSRPEKFFTVLANDRNHYLTEITVINEFHLMAHLEEYANEIPAGELAHDLFIRGYEGLTTDKRGNLRHDAGYTASNQTDATVISGMHFPCRMVGPSRQCGVGEDTTMELTLFKSGCSVMKMADWVSANHPFPKMGLAQKIFVDNQRNSLFGGRWADDLKREELKPWARFDATSCFGTGETSDWRIHKTERHRDNQNSKLENENHCPTFTKLVVVRYPNGAKVVVRLGINVYVKGCCSDTNRRLTVNDLILTAVRNDKGPSGMHTRSGAKPLHEKFARPGHLHCSRSTWALPADNDKDGHLSLYVNEIVKLGEISGRNRALMIEALYTIPLTPATDGWLWGFLEAKKVFVDSGGKMPNSFVVTYIKKMMDRKGSVSWGDWTRCQVSHRGQITKGDLFLSLQNLDNGLMRANETSNSTKFVVKGMTKPVAKGGVRNVGPFYAQVIINVATKIGLINNHEHVGNVSVSPSTATYRRLGTFGVETKAHAMEIVPFLTNNLGGTALTSENRLCETLRRLFGTDGTMDVFADGHVLYKIKDGNVYTVNTSGVWTVVTYADAAFNGTYCPPFLWWDKVGVFEGPRHEWESRVIHLKKRRIK